MRQGSDSTYGVSEVTESEQDIEEDHNQCSQDSPYSAGGDVVSDSRTYLLARHDTYFSVRIGRTEVLEGDVVTQERLAALVEQCLDSLVSLCGLFVDTVVGGDTYLVGIVTISDDVEREEFTVLQRCREGLVEILAYLLGVDILVETNDIVTSAGEIDTEVQFTEDMRFQTEDSKDYECAGEAVSPFARSYEIEVHILQEVLHQRGGEAQFLSALAFSIVLEQQTGDEHSREERRDDTDHVRNGEALDRTGTEDSEDRTGEERSHVRIHDSGDGTLETVLDSFTHAFAGAQFLTDTLVDQHVGIHSGTHRQHDTGDTRQGQYSGEGCEDTEQQEDVAQQGGIGDETRNPAIVENHVDEDEHKAQNE